MLRSNYQHIQSLYFALLLLAVLIEPMEEEKNLCGHKNWLENIDTATSFVCFTKVDITPSH
jgi:hypothetical protein